MVVGQLTQLSVPQQVRPAVANVRHTDTRLVVRLDDRGNAQGGAHTLKTPVGTRTLPHRPIGGDHRLSQPLDGAPDESVAKRVDGGSGRYLTARVAAHPICNSDQVLVGEHRVLIHEPDPPDVGHG